jgi:hypothetical membrane protein
VNQTLLRSYRGLSKLNKVAWLRIAGGAGIFAPVSAFTFIGLAVASCPQFSWVNNALSDLGVVPGVTSTLFNFGLYLSGLFCLSFAVGLFTFLGEHVVGKIGSIVFVLASLSLEGIGLFPENVRPFHLVFSIAFFTLVPIALLVVAGYYIVAHQKRIAMFTLSVAVVAAMPWVLLFSVQYVSGVAIPELVSGLAGATWTVVVGSKMIKIASRSKNP